MHLVVITDWPKEEAEAAKVIAEAIGGVAFEARQKIAAGGPVALASFADRKQAATLADKLLQGGIAVDVIDSEEVRNRRPPFRVHRFQLGPQALRVESLEGASCDIEYGTIDLLLVATSSSGQTQTNTSETERKFSLGKTLLAGGVPMTKKVTREKIVTVEERDETLWLYTRNQTIAIFERAAMNYDGFGEAMQLTRDLNFNQLKSELRRLAVHAVYDDRFLKRAALIRLLGAALAPEVNLDLAFEILAGGLRKESGRVA